MSRLCCVADADAIVRRRALVPAGQVIEAWNDLYTPGHFWLGEESKRLLAAAGEPVPPVITLPAAAVAVYYGPQLTDLESLPPEDSIKISDHRMPVLMWTEATLWMLMLISSTLNQERLRRITAFSVTSMRVAKSKLPFVHRLAWNISDAMISCFFSLIPAEQAIQFAGLFMAIICLQPVE